MGGRERLPSETIGARTSIRVEDFGKKVTRVVDDSDVFGPVSECLARSGGAEPNFCRRRIRICTSVWTEAQFVYTKWTEECTHSAQVMDMAFQAREKDLVLGTFGRGAWVIDDIEPLRVLAAGEGLKSTATFFEPPTAYQWERKQSPGVRFAGMSTFRGENRPFGARMTAYLPEVAEDNKKKIRVDYQDEGGDTIIPTVHQSEGSRDYRTGVGRCGKKERNTQSFKVRKEGEGAERSPRGTCTCRATYTVTMNWDGQSASHPAERLNTITVWNRWVSR